MTAPTSPTGLSLATDQYLAAAQRYRSGQMSSQEQQALGVQTLGYISDLTSVPENERGIINETIAGLYSAQRGVTLQEAQQVLAQERQRLNASVVPAPVAPPRAVPAATRRVVPVTMPRLAPRPPAPMSRPAVPVNNFAPIPAAAQQTDEDVARVTYLSQFDHQQPTTSAASAATVPAAMRARIPAPAVAPAALPSAVYVGGDDDAALRQAIEASLAPQPRPTTTSTTSRAPVPLPPSLSAPTNTWGALFMRGVRATYAIAMPIIRRGAVYAWQHPQQTLLYGGAALIGGAIGSNFGFFGGLGGTAVGLVVARSYERQNLQMQPAAPLPRIIVAN